MLRFLAPFALMSLLFSACNDAPPANQESGEQPATLTHQIKELKEQGGTCDDDNGDGCARILLSYPEFSGTPAADAINNAVLAALSSVLTGISISDDASENASPEALSKVFIQDYLDYREESPDMPNMGWEVETNGEVLLQNNQVAVVALSTYSFTGGAHPNTYTSLSVFDVATGNLLKWSDIVVDEAALITKAQAAFQKAREELDTEYPYNESDYFWGGPFQLSENFGFTEQGLYCYYNAYEVAPYVMGPTEFTIPYSELEGVLQLEKIR